MLSAYHQTSYHVEGYSPFTLRIGIPSKELKLLFSKTKCDCAIYLTAWNPYSQTLDETQNKLRQVNLEKEIAHRKLSSIPGYGKGDFGLWPAEPSILILGLTLEAGKSLAQKYEQNALVWAANDAVPQLVLLR